MPRHRRLTRPDAIHAVSYWQDTDPRDDGPVADGVLWHDTTDFIATGEVIEKMYVLATDEWIVTPGGGTVKHMAIPLGNGLTAVLAGVKMSFQLPGKGRIVAWRIIDPFESCDLECDVWVAVGAVPTIADSIVGTTPPEMTGAQIATGTVDPDDWTAEWEDNSWISAVVTSSAGCNGGTLQLLYVRR